MAKDFYATLGVNRSASADEIKSAYRKLSKEWHPDKHKGDKAAEAKFKEINQAYEVLSDPKKKQGYDQFGEAGASGSAGFGGSAGGGFGGFDFSNMSGNGNLNDIFESFFGGAAGGGRARQEERGADLEATITIEFRESVSGGERMLRLERLLTCATCKGSGAEPNSTLVTCTECGGTGQVTRTAQSFFGAIQQRMLCPRCRGAGKIPEKPCKRCSGEGRQHETAEVKVQIPAGIDDGQTLRLRGEGEAGRQGTPAGDLYVHVRVRPDPRFQRDGDDVRSTADLPLLDAILGTELTVATVHGKATVKIPEGTQPGTVFRIKHKGMPVLNTNRHGDHFVTVNVEVPTSLSRAERRLVEEWKKIAD